MLLDLDIGLGGVGEREADGGEAFFERALRVATEQGSELGGGVELGGELIAERGELEEGVQLAGFEHGELRHGVLGVAAELLEARGERVGAAHATSIGPAVCPAAAPFWWVAAMLLHASCSEPTISTTRPSRSASRVRPTSVISLAKKA